MLKLIFSSIMLATLTTGARAECKIWAVEDTSAGQQVRARLFAWSDLQSMAPLVEEAARIALRQAEAMRLDFVDVFLTRPQDGTNRESHSAMTSTVWMRYNPGGTPVLDEIWWAQALRGGADVKMEYGMLGGEKVELGPTQIDAILDAHFEGVSPYCSN